MAVSVCRAPGEAPRGQAFAQRLAAQQFHDSVGDALDVPDVALDAEVVNREDVWMRAATDLASLESRAVFGSPDAGQEDLDGDLASSRVSLAR
jgi:hypothetical protein